MEVNGNLGVERHQRGVKPPQPPTNQALLQFLEICIGFQFVKESFSNWRPWFTNVSSLCLSYLVGDCILLYATRGLQHLICWFKPELIWIEWLIWIGMRQQLSKVGISEIELQLDAVLFSTSVSEVGLILDNQLKMTDHVILT